MKNLKQFVTDTINNGGASYNPDTGATPSGGYMVSVFGSEVVVKKKDMNELDEAIKQFVKGNAASIYDDPQLYIGTWIDAKGDCYIDVSRNVSSIHEAKKLCVINRQQSLYDVVGKITHEVPYSISEWTSVDVIRTINTGAGGIFAEAGDKIMVKPGVSSRTFVAMNDKGAYGMFLYRLTGYRIRQFANTMEETIAHPERLMDDLVPTICTGSMVESDGHDENGWPAITHILL